MPKRKTADATIETAVPVAEPKKRASAATRTASTATHKRTTTKKAAAQPSHVPADAAPAVVAAVEPVSSPARTFIAPTHAEISRLAYSYFEQRGYQPGDPVADWLRAERELSELAQNR